MAEIFIEIGIIIIGASIVAFISRLFKQPLIPAYVIAGIILGPILSIITNKSIIATLSEIGIAFLLFIVGLEINLKNLKEVGLVASVGGIIKSTLLFSIGFFISILLGFSSIEGAYLGLIIAFSSTMVVIKFLSDKKEVSTLHGRIIIGILLVEDIIAVFAITLVNSLEQLSLAIVLISILKAAILFLIVLFVSRHILGHIFKIAAKTPEVLFLVSISVCFLFGILFNQFGDILIFIGNIIVINMTPDLIALIKPGFSIAIGSFAAGIGLANLPYSIEISSKIKPLKNFFATIFFVSLGLELEFSIFGKIVIPLIILTLVVIIFKPIILILITFMFGYSKRTSFLTGANLAQISEFSLILVTLGLSLGHVSSEIFSITVYMAIITIIFTSYFSNSQNYLYNKFSPYLKYLEKLPFKRVIQLENVTGKIENEVILVGYDRVGYSIFNTLRKLKKNFLVIDFNPEIIRKLIRQKINCIYGDIGDIEVINRLRLEKARIVISTIPMFKNNLLLIKKTKEANKKATIFMIANQVDEALVLYDAGADYVILPHFLGGERVSFLLEDFTEDLKSLTSLIEKKIEHIKELKKRKQMGYHHSG